MVSINRRTENNYIYVLVLQGDKNESIIVRRACDYEQSGGQLWGVYRRVQWKKESNHKKVLWRGYVNEFSFEDFVQFLNFSLSADISITNLYAED